MSSACAATSCPTPYASSPSSVFSMICTPSASPPRSSSTTPGTGSGSGASPGASPPAAVVAAVAGDIREVEVERDFDAVVGRLVLMYSADPAATLRAALRAVRDDG